MPYVVTRTKPKKKNVDLLDFLNGLVTMKMLEPPSVFETTGTRTVYYDYIAPERRQSLQLAQKIEIMDAFYRQYRHLSIDDNPKYLYELQVELESKYRREYPDEQELRSVVSSELEQRGFEYCTLYHTFYLPKKSSKPGHTKWRRIDAPCAELASCLRALKAMFEALMDGCTYHTAAFAYIPKRCPVDAVRKHANNKSNWELKLDFSNFFGSIDLDFLIKMLCEVYPFSEFDKYEGGVQTLRNCLKLAMLNNGLPQGTPLSPMLTNIVMIAIDQKISNGLRNHAIKSPTSGRTYDYIYTRYADDMTISNRMKFDPQEVIGYVQAVLNQYDAPLKLNKEKTRFGSNAGSNWMLGVMYNQQYEVTVGHKRKKQLKAALTNYAMDRRNGRWWQVEDLQQLQGEISYCRSVEKQKIDNIISKYCQKFGLDIMTSIKMDIKAGLKAQQ